MKTYIINGLKANHTIVIMPDELTNAVWEQRGYMMDGWCKPASGNGFKTANLAKAWLTKFLQKPGWNRAYRFEIWRSGSHWHVYEV